ncbi:hypothetical protein HDU98_001617 [Podochytrium sp. JEL0797]|nr:hypothetical protein HDU98_001617 [Podochytrium sp. JEL0797]
MELTTVVAHSAGTGVSPSSSAKSVRMVRSTGALSSSSSSLSGIGVARKAAYGAVPKDASRATTTTEDTTTNTLRKTPRSLDTLREAFLHTTPNSSALPFPKQTTSRRALRLYRRAVASKTLAAIAVSEALLLLMAIAKYANDCLLTPRDKWLNELYATDSLSPLLLHIHSIATILFLTALAPYLLYMHINWHNLHPHATDHFESHIGIALLASVPWILVVLVPSTTASPWPFLLALYQTCLGFILVWYGAVFGLAVARLPPSVQRFSGGVRLRRIRGGDDDDIDSIRDNDEEDGDEDEEEEETARLLRESNQTQNEVAGPSDDFDDQEGSVLFSMDAIGEPVAALERGSDAFEGVQVLRDESGVDGVSGGVDSGNAAARSTLTPSASPWRVKKRPGSNSLRSNAFGGAAASQGFGGGSGGVRKRISSYEIAAMRDVARFEAVAKICVWVALVVVGCLVGMWGMMCGEACGRNAADI